MVDHIEYMKLNHTSKFAFFKCKCEKTEYLIICKLLTQKLPFKLEIKFHPQDYPTAQNPFAPLACLLFRCSYYNLYCTNDFFRCEIYRLYSVGAYELINCLPSFTQRGQRQNDCCLTLKRLHFFFL